MLAFNARTDDDSLSIVLFATSTSQSASLFCDIYLARYGTMPPAFSIERRTIAKETNKGALRRALSRGVGGVATMDAGEWLISAALLND